MAYVMVLALVGLVFGMMGSYVADSKGRPGIEGLIFGFLLGPLGLLVVVLMPTVAKAKPQVRQEPVQEPAPEVDPVRRPKPLRCNPGDDKAMEFTMELIRRGEDQTGSVPRIQSRSLRQQSDN